MYYIPYITGIADDDGKIDQAEFIILCMVRTGAASPRFVRSIIHYFSVLDTSRCGYLTTAELCRRGGRRSRTVSTDKQLEQKESAQENVHRSTVRLTERRQHVLIPENEGTNFVHRLTQNITPGRERRASQRGQSRILSKPSSGSGKA